MRHTSQCFVVAAILAVTGHSEEPGNAAVPPLLPAEDFARPAEAFKPTLSPDGKFVGYVKRDTERASMAFLDLESGRTNQVLLGTTSLDWNKYTFRMVSDYHWVSDERVVMLSAGWTGVGGLSAADRSSENFEGLTGLHYRREKHKVRDDLPRDSWEVIGSPADKPDCVLLLTPHGKADDAYLHPDVAELNTRDAAGKVVLTNPGNVTSWLTNEEGVVCLGTIVEGNHAKFIYRAGAGDAWHALPGLEAAPGEIVPLHVFSKTQRLVFAQTGKNGRRGLYAYQLDKGRVEDAPVFQHVAFDVLPLTDSNGFYASDWNAMVFSPARGDLLGIRYLADGQRMHWFSPAMADVQKNLDEASPGMINDIVGMDRSMRRLLIETKSDREPGLVFLLDLPEMRVRRVLRTCPWVRSDLMAEMYPVKFPARDGLELDGYLTLPKGRGQKGLPAVVLVHDGPHQRVQWGYDPMVQFLANRGYAVLQVNYRGSQGYGTEFAGKGSNVFDGDIPNDVGDAVAWATKHGLFDPERVAVMGNGLGGYFALQAAAREPKRYRCAVLFGAISDWANLVEHKGDKDYFAAYDYWSAVLPELKDPALLPRLEKLKPETVARQTKMPFLLLHGKEDQYVPVQQSYWLARALRSAGAKVTVHYYGNWGHGMPYDDEGKYFLKALEKFLEEQLKSK